MTPETLWLTREGLLVQDGETVRDMVTDRGPTVPFADVIADLVLAGRLTLQQIVDACEAKRPKSSAAYRQAPFIVPSPSSAHVGCASCSDAHGDCPFAPTQD